MIRLRRIPAAAVESAAPFRAEAMAGEQPVICRLPDACDVEGNEHTQL